MEVVHGRKPNITKITLWFDIQIHSKHTWLPTDVWQEKVSKSNALIIECEVASLYMTSWHEMNSLKADNTTPDMEMKSVSSRNRPHSCPSFLTISLIYLKEHIFDTVDFTILSIDMVIKNFMGQMPLIISWLNSSKWPLVISDKFVNPNSFIFSKYARIWSISSSSSQELFFLWKR